MGDPGARWRTVCGMMGRVPVLYLVACAAPPTQQLPEAVPLLQADGWDVCVVATPVALAGRFLNRGVVERVTGHHVRVMPDDPRHPAADVVAAVPLTANMLAKWATLINDNTAVGILNETLGSNWTADGPDTPMVADVWAKEELRAHPAYNGHVSRLSGAGVRFLPPGSGYDRYPWEELRDALRRHLPQT